MLYFQQGRQVGSSEWRHLELQCFSTDWAQLIDKSPTKGADKKRGSKEARFSGMRGATQSKFRYSLIKEKKKGQDRRLNFLID